MGEPILHEGHWWYRHENGAWSRWDPATGQWIPFSGYYPSPVAKYSSVDNLGRWVVRVIAADMAFSLLTIFVGVNELAAIDGMSNAELERYFAGGAAYSLVTQLAGAVSLAAGVTFIMWFYRAYQNLPAFGTYGRYRSGWAIGSWIVPILNLFRPKQIADDIWRGSAPGATTNDVVHPQRRTVPALMHWWWAVWVALSVTGFVVIPIAIFSGDLQAEPFESIIRGFNLSLVVAGIGRIVAGALAIPVVLRITRRQEQRAADANVARAS